MNRTEARQRLDYLRRELRAERMSYGELAEWHGYFVKLARKFNLTDEFRENGIL